jgi:RNA ligase (TIGR02306 family)
MKGFRMAISTHEVPVVQIKLEEHPNADALSIVKIDGYTVCVRTADWEDGQLAAYIPPDSLVKTTRPEFAFLAREGRDVERIKVMKLRGIVSMGCLVPAPEGFSIGQDAAAELEVEHYEPSMKVLEGDNGPGPSLYSPKYDVETIRKYHRMLREGEEVYVSEKIHGASARYVYHDGQMWIGSRTKWKIDGSPWHRAFYNHPEMHEFFEKNPDLIVYGEIYGQVQNLKYDCGNKIRFAAFDILQRDRWMDADKFIEVCTRWNIPKVPTLYVGPYSFDKVEELAEGQSKIAGHIREGCVVRPTMERMDPRLGRVILKCVGNGYYTYQGKKK